MVQSTVLEWFNSLTGCTLYFVGREHPAWIPGEHFDPVTRQMILIEDSVQSPVIPHGYQAGERMRQDQRVEKPVYTDADVLQILANHGIPIKTCGACAENSFSGATTLPHACKPDPDQGPS